MLSSISTKMQFYTLSVKNSTRIANMMGGRTFYRISMNQKRFYNSGFGVPGDDEEHNQIMLDIMKSTEERIRKRIKSVKSFSGFSIPDEGTEDYPEWEKEVLRGIKEIHEYNENLKK